MYSVQFLYSCLCICPFVFLLSKFSCAKLISSRLSVMPLFLFYFGDRYSPGLVFRSTSLVLSYVIRFVISCHILPHVHASPCFLFLCFQIDLLLLSYWQQS